MMVHTQTEECQLSPVATSILFKLSAKLSQADFVIALHRLCGYPADERPYNFIHLPWKQLAVVNFTSHEACDFCFRVMKCIAGVPGVPVADVREGLHKGLEANLAHFCAKCCQMSTYETLPLVFVNNEEIPLSLACQTLVSDDMLSQFLENLPGSMARKPANKAPPSKARASEAPKAKRMSPCLEPGHQRFLPPEAFEPQTPPLTPPITPPMDMTDGARFLMPKFELRGVDKFRVPITRAMATPAARVKAMEIACVFSVDDYKAYAQLGPVIDGELAMGFKYSGRNIEKIYQKAVQHGRAPSLFEAVTTLQKASHVLIITGFFVLHQKGAEGPHGDLGGCETDGPLGALAVLRALCARGVRASLFCDVHNGPVIKKAYDAWPGYPLATTHLG
eukprot:g9431.t1